MSRQVILTPAYVLHRRDYNDTSQIVDFLTLHQGYVSCVARGIKKSRHNRQALVQPFVPLLISFAGKGSLKTLVNCEPADQLLDLSGNALYAGFYLNELVMQFVRKYDVSPEIFVDYAQVMLQLGADQPLEEALRFFELNLLQHAGIGLPFFQDQHIEIDSAAQYLYSPSANTLKFSKDSIAESHEIPVTGETLLALKKGRFTSELQRRQGKQLMRAVIHFLLEGYCFRSRSYFANLYNKNKQ